MASWLECMIGELAPSSAPTDICSFQGVLEGHFSQQTSGHYGIDDVYGPFGCTRGTDYQLNKPNTFLQDSFPNPQPKQGALPSVLLQTPVECVTSIPQLIRDAIGNQGGASATADRNESRSSYPGVTLPKRDVGGLHHYKELEDQGSCNQAKGFCAGNSTQPCLISHVSLQKSCSMPSLHQLQQAGHISATQARGSFSFHTQHQTQGQSFSSPAASPATTSSQNSNNKATYHEAPSVRFQQQLHRKVNQEEVKITEPEVTADLSPSSSSPMSVSYQEHCSPQDKDSIYHMRYAPSKHANSQTMQTCPYTEVVDYENVQESGIKLVHLLMACAEAIQNNALAAAVDMVREIKRLASSTRGTMSKVANYFVESLARCIYPGNKCDWAYLCQADALSELLYANFYEALPYLKFAHFTANQAILEAFQGHKFVHIIDFNLMQGSQWPALIQALADREEGPPYLRMTGIGLPHQDNKDVLQEVGKELAELAHSVNVKFSFRGMVATKLEDVKPWYFEVNPGEAIAVNSILQMHRLLYGCVGSDPSKAPIDEVLSFIKSLKPKVVTLVEQEANHNGSIFLERFVEALHYYSTMFDSLEASSLDPQSSEMACAEAYLAREITNVLACEGAERVERHEPLSQWRKRMSNAGFKPLHLGSNAFNKVSVLLKVFSGEGYTVEENKGCLTLGWHNRPLIASSAWQCG
ncbi:hypothetical protein KP509_28G047900 [Ceratopteris richardii]|nr:hypothetical protein KP509_28G047900 [Ceratopteris richardii]